MILILQIIILPVTLGQQWNSKYLTLEQFSKMHSIDSSVIKSQCAIWTSSIVFEMFSLENNANTPLSVILIEI